MYCDLHDTNDDAVDSKKTKRGWIIGTVGTKNQCAGREIATMLLDFGFKI